MDKATFETYEYLPTNSGEAETDQFFVVQDDGTFLLNRQVQYVAQVQDVKETLDGAQACTVYDVTPQQFFVDVADNNTELISVTDILPETNNFYGNSFLLQPIPNENTEQVEAEKDLTTQFKETTQQEELGENAIINNITKQGTSCTEITMTDEQYKALEQKGWVLLETNDKIFILDTYGLHDITTNQDLIQSLRNDSKSGNNAAIEAPSIITTENDIKTESESDKSKLEVYIQNPQEVVNNDIVNVAVQDESNKINATKLNVISAEELVETSEMEQNSIPVKDELLSSVCPTEPDKKSQRVSLEKHKEDNYIRIKTKQCFKSIPDKIILGKTFNGKRLVAKVIKCTRKEDNIKAKADEKDIPIQSQLVEPNKTSETGNNIPDPFSEEKQLEKLFQLAIRGDVECSPAQVAAAYEVVCRLLQVPAFQLSVVGRNIIVTKIKESKVGTRSTRTASFVTGIVTSVDNDTCFLHVPNLLQKIISECSASKTKEKVLHVHISETKYENNVDAISVILNERELPSEERPYKKTPSRQASRLYACGSCASIFQSETELAEHQETHAIDAEGALTIDTDKLPKNSTPVNVKGYPYYVEKSSKGTIYTCLQCSMKFTKLSNCLRHIKNYHSSQQKSTDQNTEEKTVKKTPREPPYKCKMCHCSYFYPSSLSKHISKDHLQGKVNTIIGNNAN